MLSSKGRYFCFKTDVVEIPNGKRTIRDIVDHPGAVAVIPVLPYGRMVLVMQYRYAVQTPSRLNRMIVDMTKKD